MSLSRRRFLTTTAATAGAVAAAGATGRRLVRPAAAATIDPATCPVEHIVVLMMENRSFDNMLGRLPGVDGLEREMTNANEEGDPVFPHRMQDFTATIADLDHSRSGSVEQWNEGANNRFVKTSGGQAMGYLAPNELPWLYAVAAEYVTFDRWFCSLLGPTWPNREYFFAGTSAGRTGNDFSAGKLGLWERTVWHQLSDVGVDWGIYFADVPSAALYFDVVLRWGKNFKPMYKFYQDASAGTLPRVTFLEPGYIIGTDDHPPANLQNGQRLMADIVRALMNSPQWPTTALIITYDEHGGFFDHVSPPTMPDDYPELGNPIGFRVPTLLISPYTRRGEIINTDHDATSALKFIQWRHGLDPLTTRNAAANNILNAFDFDNPRFEIPTLPVPSVDHRLTALVNVGRILGPDGHHFNMPGGEGPEAERLWTDTAFSGDESAAVALGEEADTPPILPLDGLDAKPKVGGHPELYEAADMGLIPKELDLRPGSGNEDPQPFLPAGELPDKPLWKPKKLKTASQLPDAKTLARRRHRLEF